MTESAFLVPRRLFVPADATSARPVGTLFAPGDPVADAGPESGHAPLAPVAGRIVDTARVRLTNGREVPAVVVETDGPDAAASDAGSDDGDPTPEQVADALANVQPGAVGDWLDRIRRAGVWADRWTSPDLLGQLRQCAGRPAGVPVDTVVCNLLDADPAVAVNRAVARDHGAQVVAAVAALARLTGATRVWAVVDEADDPSQWAAIRRTAAVAADALRVVPLENHYPQADPVLLLYTLTRRRLRPGRPPTEAGVLLLDAAAAAAVGRAVLEDEPVRRAMLRVPVAVYDQPRDKTHVLSVHVGTVLGDLLEHLDLPRHGLDLRGGGPLREVCLGPDAVIAGGELGVYATPREPDVNPDPCVRCGWCVEGCPTRIHPAGLLDAAQQRDLKLARRYGLDACVECGVCSYVCPSHLPLLEGIRELRKQGDKELGRHGDKERGRQGEGETRR